MNDYGAIHRLLTEYCIGSDSGDVDRWANCFADEIVLERPFGSFNSKEAGRTFFEAGRDAARNYRHINSNAIIDIDGDSAKVTSYLQVYDQTASPPNLIFIGFYNDQLVKREGRWLIHRRTLAS